MNINQLRLKNKKTYMIVNSNTFNNEDDFLDAIAKELKEGIDIIELRESCSTPDKIIRIGKKIRELCSIFNTLFIINDRIDIAQVIQADGILLNRFSFDILYARELTNDKTIIGKVVSNKEEIEDAEKKGADFLVFEEEINARTELPFFILGKCKKL